MATRQNSGSHYENHQRAAELHDLAAHAHRAAAEQNDKQDHLTGQELSKQAMERSHEAYLFTQHVHQRATSGHGIVLFGHEDTAALAYELWRARGCPEGSPELDWLHAVEQVRLHK